jgi:ferredoxin
MQQVRKALKAKSKTLNAGFYIEMGSNNIELYALKSEKSLQKLFVTANKKVETIAQIVNRKQEKIEHGIMLMNWIIGSKVNQGWLKRVHENDHKYFVEEQCNSCGTCVKVCPVDNITLEHGIPTWHHHCEECRACIHHCPQMAIQINAKTKKQGRYIHPEIRVCDIMNQK